MIRHLVAALLAALSFTAAAAVAAPVDANQASQSELETVKGIGPGLSGKIIAARQQAAFKDWADLVDRVGGVGPGNAARFSQAGLTVAGAAYAAPAPASTKTSATAPATSAAKPAAATDKPARAPRSQAEPSAPRKPAQP